MKKTMLALGLVSGLAVLADPTVSEVTLTQDDVTKMVTVRYTLSGAPAVITADFVTNGTALAAKDVRDGLNGDVNRYVATDGVKTFTWQPTVSSTGLNVAALKAGVRAWPTSRPPAYMVVDFAEKTAQRVSYYMCEDALPGGIASDVYRQSKMVLRRIDAKGVTWKMGDASSSWSVTLTNDYYMGVFEVTKAQWAIIGGNNRTSGFDVESVMRPMANVNYVQVRWNNLNASWGEDGAGWPAAPQANSYLGKLRTRTGVAFDLPSEGEWEFAARAGHAGDVLGDGSAATAENLAKIGRFSGNGGTITAAFDANDGIDSTLWTTENGTAKVGSYKPNDWGLYDMHGNVWEFCLGWWGSIYGKNGYPITTKPSDPKTPSRGGCYLSSASGCMASSRGGLINYYLSTGEGATNIGFRLVCAVPAGQ